MLIGMLILAYAGIDTIKMLLKINSWIKWVKIKDYNTLQQLREAGKTVKNQIDEITKTNPEIQYLLIIEGQASKDNYSQNYELSYERALALSRFWQSSGIDFGKNCEVLISGSGTGGSMRDSYEKNNQRFLIHIIPKTGKIEQKNNEN